MEFEIEYFNEKKLNGKIHNLEDDTTHELINGKGYIKEYNFNRKLLFEGEYLNGLRNGKGKEYYYFQIIYDGEYLNGLKSGKVN